MLAALCVEGRRPAAVARHDIRGRCAFFVCRVGMAEIAVALVMLAGAGGGLYWYVESQKAKGAAPATASPQEAPAEKMAVTVASGGMATPTGTGATSIGATPVVQTSIAATIVPHSDPIPPPAAAQAQVQTAAAAQGAPPPSNPCVTSEWSAWSACDPGQGQQRQTRTVTSGDCTGVDLVQTQPCPVDAQAGPWGQWGQCDPLTGYQTRTRSVASESLNGGAPA